MARAFGLAAIPVLSRLYSPSEFGGFALYTSTVLVLAPLATLRYHVAIALPTGERSAAALAHSSGRMGVENDAGMAGGV